MMTQQLGELFLRDWPATLGVVAVPACFLQHPAKGLAHDLLLRKCEEIQTGLRGDSMAAHVCCACGCSDANIASTINLHDISSNIASYRQKSLKFSLYGLLTLSAFSTMIAPGAMQCS